MRMPLGSEKHDQLYNPFSNFGIRKWLCIPLQAELSASSILPILGQANFGLQTGRVFGSSVAKCMAYRGSRVPGYQSQPDERSTALNPVHEGGQHPRNGVTRTTSSSTTTSD
eukprot:726727-Rhodomonas_salina.7